MFNEENWYMCECGALVEIADETTICPECRSFGCWVEVDEDCNAVADVFGKAL